MTETLSADPVVPVSRSYDVEAPQALWAVGVADSIDGLIDYPISNRDMSADIRWATGRLGDLGVSKGALLDFVHDYRECGQFWPYYMAAAAIGAPVMNGMATPWDAGRTEMYTRRFDLGLVMGVNSATLEGLVALGHDPAEVFARTSMVCAREPGASELEAAGLNPWRLTLLGPLLLIAPANQGAPYDLSQWTVEADGEGCLLITACSDRAARFDRLDSGKRGRVEGGLVFLSANS